MNTDKSEKFVNKFDNLIEEFEGSFGCTIEKKYKEVIRENYSQYLGFLQGINEESAQKITNWGKKYAEVMVRSYILGQPQQEIALYIDLFAQKKLRVKRRGLNQKMLSREVSLEMIGHQCLEM